MIAIISAIAVFNLLCTGTQVQGSGKVTSQLAEALGTGRAIPEGAHSSFSEEIRVDLNRSRWCFHAQCSITFPIDRMTEDMLRFAKGCDGAACTNFEVDRETGEFRYRELIGDLLTTATGTCRRRPSPGLPKPKF